MEDIEIRLVKNKKEYEQVLKIRETVFVKEQNVSKDIEYDEHEKDSKHVVALFRDTPIGCARIRNVGDMIKLERLAFLKEYRGKGFGKSLMKYLVDYSQKQNPREIYGHAQYYLLDFYKKLGFTPRGEIFKEADIDHIEIYIKKSKC